MGNSRKEEKRREEDILFLKQMREAPREELLRLLANNSHKNAPEWKKAAIERALARSIAASKKGEELTP